jgi:hypothetical protein
MNKTNLVPLNIDGRPLHALDQTELRFLRTMANLTGLTIAEFIDQQLSFSWRGRLPATRKRTLSSFRCL